MQQYAEKYLQPPQRGYPKHNVLCFFGLTRLGKQLVDNVWELFKKINNLKKLLWKTGYNRTNLLSHLKPASCIFFFHTDDSVAFTLSKGCESVTFQPSENKSEQPRGLSRGNWTCSCDVEVVSPLIRKAELRKPFGWEAKGIWNRKDKFSYPCLTLLLYDDLNDWEPFTDKSDEQFSLQIYHISDFQLSQKSNGFPFFF